MFLIDHCKYCKFCSLCSLCDTVCNENSVIGGALGRIGSFFSSFSAPADLPDEEVDTAAIDAHLEQKLKSAEPSPVAPPAAPAEPSPVAPPAAPAQPEEVKKDL